MKDRELPRRRAPLRTWALAACAVAGVLTAVLLYGQIPEVSQTPPRWEYTVLRIAPPASESELSLLSNRINGMADQDWQYVGLLSLENTRTGKNGIVLFRRLER